ncbi:major capsid protein [Bradyrhizobium manausense]|nr:major capsid protein [Bradyrhizobium manausense]
MVSMDVFRQDAFSATNMTAGIDREGYVPTLLAQIPDLFVPPPLGQPSSKWIFVEERDNEPVLIQTSPRGAEPSMGRTDEPSRKVTPFQVPRLFRSRRITASEVAGIRAYGQTSVMQSLDMMVARKQYLIQKDMALTWEHMRIGAVQGKVLDADGSTIYDYAAQFNQAIPAEVTWVLSPSTDDGTIRTHCSVVRRGIVRALKGMGGNAVTVHGLASDTFWDALMASAEVRHTYQYAMQATKLQENAAWQSFSYGGIMFWNYRGTDDNSAVAVPAGKCKFFPAGAGIFQEVFAPADERFEFVNTPGQEAYCWIVLDEKRNMWADVEMYSYPLFMCTQPSALASAGFSLS